MIKKSNTLMYHLFQYVFSFCIFCFCRGKFFGPNRCYYYLLERNAIKLAINLYAPGIPAGNSRKNTRPA